MIRRTIGTGALVLPVMLLALGLAAVQEACAQDPPPIGLEEGQMYPDFHLPTIDGQLARLSDYRGKKILLFHFASW